MQTKELYKKLADFGRELLEKRSLPEGLPLIATYAKEVIGADRVSIFLANDTKDLLWTKLADGIDKIEIAANKGIVGRTFQTKTPQLVNDLNKDPDFYEKIDKESGYRTYNILAAPIYDCEGEVVGVLELLNKDGGFEQKDIKLLKLFAHSISSFVELMRLEE